MTEREQQIFRILVGNQIAMMRMLKTLAPPAHERDLDLRVSDVKDFWRGLFKEEVGFSSTLGDRPRERARYVLWVSPTGTPTYVAEGDDPNSYVSLVEGGPWRLA